MNGVTHSNKLENAGVLARAGEEDDHLCCRSCVVDHLPMWALLFIIQRSHAQSQNLWKLTTLLRMNWLNSFSLHLKGRFQDKKLSTFPKTAKIVRWLHDNRVIHHVYILFSVFLPDSIIAGIPRCSQRRPPEKRKECQFNLFPFTRLQA